MPTPCTTRRRVRTRPLFACLAVAAGCAEWPRFAHLPTTESQFPASIDPASLVNTAWDPIGQESTTSLNDLPTDADVPVADLAIGEGVLFVGNLDGVGWSDNAEPASITSSSCAGATGTRAPLASGDYIGDVDFLRVRVPVNTTLCARVMLPDAADLGWDLVPFQTDECGIPMGPVTEDGEAVGVNRGGGVGGWGIATTHDRYAVSLAGYFPNEPERLAGYVLGLAVVPAAQDGGAGLCPLLPDDPGASGGPP